jgi:hypothetical protein
MLKLLKYDWKRNAAFLLGVLAIVILLQTALTVTALTRDWDEFVVYILGTMLYSLATLLTVGQCCKSYDQSLRVYNRRLLPTHPLQSVGAIIILSLVCVVVIGVIALIHNYIYFSMMGRHLADIVELDSLTFGSVMGITVSFLWSVVMIILTILVAITIGHSINTKQRIWIGIVSFFGLAILLSWVENELLELDSTNAMFGIVSVQMTSTSGEGTIQLPASLHTAIAAGPMLVEALFAAGFLYLIHYLASKKIGI